MIRTAQYEFKTKIFVVILLRGVLEFTGSMLYLVSLKIALDSGVNQGICSSMITIAGLFIAIISYFAYGEKLNFPQFVGMVTVLAAIALMGFY